MRRRLKKGEKAKNPEFGPYLWAHKTNSKIPDLSPVSGAQNRISGAHSAAQRPGLLRTRYPGERPNRHGLDTCPGHGKADQAQSDVATWPNLGLTRVPEHGIAVQAQPKAATCPSPPVNPVGCARESAGAMLPAADRAPSVLPAL